MNKQSLLIQRLEKKSFEIRKKILELCIKAGTGHVTSSMSCVDIMVTLYYGGVMDFDPKNPQWPQRDRFIVSKGQASPALYAILADLGYFDIKELDKFAQKDGKFGVHLQKDVPGVELTVGSLGQAFGVAAGIALGAKLNRELYMIFTLLGDGECYEGSVWETAMFASHYRLNNLVAIIDRNYLCVTDFTENLIALEPLEKKWESFGWNVVRIDGHSFSALLEALKDVKSRKSQKPLVIIADTVKGKGIKSMCYQPLWHAVVPKGEEEKIAIQCLKKEYENEPE